MVTGRINDLRGRVGFMIAKSCIFIGVLILFFASACDQKTSSPVERQTQAKTAASDANQQVNEDTSTDTGQDPYPITNLQHTVADGTVSMSWDPVQEAQVYHVLWKIVDSPDTPELEFTEVAEFQIPNLAPGKYLISVFAAGELGAGLAAEITVDIP